jgi:hypothetical protein
MRILVLAACLGSMLGSPLFAQHCNYPTSINIECRVGNCDQFIAVDICSGSYGNPYQCNSVAYRRECCGQYFSSAGNGFYCGSAAALNGKVISCNSTVRATAAKDLGEAKTPAKEQPKLVVEQEGSVERVTQTKTGN